MDQPLHENWVLMARVLGGEATDDEVQKLYTILANDEQLSQQYELMDRLWKEEHKGEDYKSVENSDKEIQRIIHLAEEKFELENETKPVRRIYTFRKIAIAVVSIAASFMLVYFGYKKIKPNSYIEPAVVLQVLKTNNGTRSRNILPDGSIVWLNAGSSLTLSPGFKTKDRNVNLIGEGYFEVVKNPFPFIVLASGINIKVVGTAFNVRSYPTDKTVETTLFHGVIKLSRQGDKANEITLKPHEKFIISRQELLIASTEKHPLEQKGIIQLIGKDPDDRIIEKAWVYNRLEFRGDDLEMLATKLDRWYDVKIRFTDNEVKKLKFNGSFERETIDDALKYLQIANPFSYKINDHEILIGSY